ncbi:MAG: transketolase-like TK C-terminal-containing protein, partial [Longimicrobiales bacterium]
LRAIPNVMDLRPGDGPETEIAWRAAIERVDGPSFLALSRQKVPLLTRIGSAVAADDSVSERLASAEGLRRGAYVLAEASGGEPAVLIMASGSELSLALDARSRLESDGIPTRVVSMPSWYLFAQQDPAYRDEVLPPSLAARLSVEAGSTFGWERWIGSQGRSIGIDHFGASAPADVLYEKFGITVDAVVEAAKEVVAGR